MADFTIWQMRNLSSIMLVFVFFATFVLGLNQDPNYLPEQYFDVQVGVRCAGQIFGEQGATSMEDCEYNCWVVNST